MRLSTKQVKQIALLWPKFWSLCEKKTYVKYALEIKWFFFLLDGFLYWDSWPKIKTESSVLKSFSSGMRVFLTLLVWKCSGLDLCGCNWFFVGFLKEFIHLFIRDTERGRDTKQAPCGEPDVGLGPKTRDQDLSQRQVLNYWATRRPMAAILRSFYIKSSFRYTVAY